MRINIILGNSIDSLTWVKKLKADGEKMIVVLDYDLKEEMHFKNDTVYISPECARKLVKEISTVRYFKSLHVYPGMYKELG